MELVRDVYEEQADAIESTMKKTPKQLIGYSKGLENLLFDVLLVQDGSKRTQRATSVLAREYLHKKMNILYNSNKSSPVFKAVLWGVLVE